MSANLKWNLYVITDEKLSKGRSHLEIAREAIAGGADVIQLRDKEASSRKLFEVGCQLRNLTRKTATIYIVNDRLDIALATDADGLHVGQDDLPAEVARRLLGEDKILGVSARSVEEAIEAQQAGADYLGLGPVFEARGSKADAGEPLGLTLIRETRKHCSLPIVAIGGIHAGNVGEVIRAGADAVAVISAVVSAEDIRQAARQLKEQITLGKESF
ncbi:MAG: thiamine phosphate synthase [Calditrichia bacterium]